MSQTFPAFLQDNTNIDAAISCLVKNIMLLEEEKSQSDGMSKPEEESSILVLPGFDYNKKETGFDGCTGCPSLKPKDRDYD